MRKLLKTILIPATLLTVLPALAQQDPHAERILKRLSEKTESYSSLKMDFTVKVEDKQRGTTDKFGGTVLIKGEKYRLDVFDTKTYFDGEAVYTYLTDVDEVMISDPEEEEDETDMFSNPAKILRVYEENFKYRMRGEVNLNGKTHYEIDLHPEEREVEFHTIKLFIDKEDTVLHKAVISGKDGSVYTIEIQNIETNMEVSKEDFTFDPEEHPGVEVIDMRW